MTREQIRSNILSALGEIKRPGMPSLIEWLKASDYFIAPSSTKFHCNYEGGLAEHSWNVFDLLVKKDDQYHTRYAFDTLAICGLLHDLCKVNFYKISIEPPTGPQLDYLDKLMRGRKVAAPGVLTKEFVSILINHYKNGGTQENEPAYVQSYTFDDKFPVGHGEKSVFLILKHIVLHDEEIMAIRWHMTAFDAGIHFNYPSGYPYQQAVSTSALVTLLFTADMEASNILENPCKIFSMSTNFFKK